MYDAVSAAVDKARKGDGPTLIEAKTYRHHGHHVGDAQTYRTRDEVSWWSDNKDPITLLGKYMITNKVAKKAELDALYEQVDQEVLAAIEFGKDAPFPPSEQAFEDIYA
jgi:pyruvate dehydrogenase E1 component alpha subunit